MSVPAAKLFVSWDDVKGRIDTGDNGPELRRSGAGPTRFTCITGAGEQTLEMRFNSRAHASVLGLFEEALRGGGDVAGANSAYFFKQRIDNGHFPGRIYYLAEPGIVDSSLDYLSSCLLGRTSDCFWGYGVKPWRVASALMVLWSVLVAGFLYGGTGIVGSWRFDPDWSFSSYPVLAGEADDWTRTEVVGRILRPLGCALVGLHAIAGLRLFDLWIYKGDGEQLKPWLRLAKWIAAVGGAFALVAIGQAVPVISKVVGFLLK